MDKLEGLLSDRQFDKVLIENGWRKRLLGNAYLRTGKWNEFYLCTWMTTACQGEKAQPGTGVEKIAEIL